MGGAMAESEYKIDCNHQLDRWLQNMPHHLRRWLGYSRQGGATTDRRPLETITKPDTINAARVGGLFDGGKDGGGDGAAQVDGENGGKNSGEIIMIMKEWCDTE